MSLKGLVFSPFNILSCERFNNNNFSKMFEAVPFPAADDCSLRIGYYGGGTSWLLVTRASLPAGGMEIRIVLTTFSLYLDFEVK